MKEVPEKENIWGLFSYCHLRRTISKKDEIILSNLEGLYFIALCNLSVEQNKVS